MSIEDNSCMVYKIKWSFPGFVLVPKFQNITKSCINRLFESSTVLPPNLIAVVLFFYTCNCCGIEEVCEITQPILLVSDFVDIA